MSLPCLLINSLHSGAAGSIAGGSTAAHRDPPGRGHRWDPPAGRADQRLRWDNRREPGTGLLTKLLHSWALTPKSNNKSLRVHSGLLGLPCPAVCLQGRKALLAFLLIAQSTNLWLLGQPPWDPTPPHLC